jgi:hypothetical protein
MTKKEVIKRIKALVGDVDTLITKTEMGCQPVVRGALLDAQDALTACSDEVKKTLQLDEIK